MSLSRMPHMSAVMTPFPYSVDLDAPIADAEVLMQEHEIRHLPVKEGTELVGVVSERDVRVTRSQAPGAALTVRDACVRDVCVFDLQTPLHRVAAGMAELRADCALITKAGRLAGIFTATDACLCLAEYLSERFGEGGDLIA
jgi:acetoin utilization protein AcuB